MSNVTLEIAGRKYQVASAAGEEAHIERLGRMIDDRLSGQEGMASQSGERCLLYAALILADELAEGGGALLSAPDIDVTPFEKMADRLEALADRLETAPGNP